MRPIKVLTVAAFATVFVSLANFANADEEAKSSSAPPSVEVGVIEIAPETVNVVAELPGRINPMQVSDVRPRVGGIIVKRVFQQGTTVNAGDVLFEIDPVTYEVAVQSARAGVARAEAVLVNARQTEARAVRLKENDVSSAAQVETAKAALLQAEAELASSKAELRRAEIELGFTKVKAPIAGRIGRANVTEGALVSAGGTEVLTTIQTLDPVYADILQPVSEVLALRRALESGKLVQLETGVAQVRLQMDDGSVYPHPGKLLFAEASVERSSGQVAIRAEFPNKDNFLLPGMYVRVTVDQASQNDAITVPSQSVQRDPSGKAQVYVVGQDNAAAIRPITVGRALGNRVVVDGGLSKGDRVVVDGVQKIRAGAAVKPVEWVDPSSKEDTTTGSTDPDEVGATHNKTGENVGNDHAAQLGREATATTASAGKGTSALRSDAAAN